MHLLVGTSKGLFRYQSHDRRAWKSMGPALLGDEVYTSAFDRESGMVFAGANSVFYGPAVRRSEDWGEHWDTGGAGLAYGADDAETVTRIWSIRPAGNRVVYAGVEASGLFRSLDGGDQWTEVAALRQHPTHDSWVPGYGGKCLHTIAIDPFDSERLYIACSAGGIYRSDDRGESWRPINRGIRAEFNPEAEQYPESGQCVHKFWMSPARPGRLWLQNHGGVYRSDDGGDAWVYVGASLPSDFGFPVVGHPTNPEQACVIPVLRDPRWPHENVLAVHRTTDGGEHWEALTEGLPRAFYAGVLRDGFSGDKRTPQGLYFGTTSGEVYASPDEGAHWHLVASHLPRIYSVVAADDA